MTQSPGRRLASAAVTYSVEEQIGSEAYVRCFSRVSSWVPLAEQ
ncbi:MAG TPA: hypothetical protein VG253_02080 [Streptosporangiaceae bacterium]|nr:hypothetical protein [Streptosporangiaceae bacterium]